MESGVHYEVTEAGCWEWLGARNRTNYGLSGPGLRKVHYLAYRAAYIVAHGPMPEGYVIDHLCRNPPCVNPKHLEAVHPAINIRRGKVAKLTIEDAREIRRMVRQGYREFDIAPKFGITCFTVWQIAEGITWREDPNVPEPVAKHERDCPVCGVDITSGRRGKTYCSTECRLENDRRRKRKVRSA
jgi:predicted nucleic acid-binding Zn ribbon protein